MGLALNDHCRNALRPFLLAALATLAWLIWGAGTANAALPDTDSLRQLVQASTSTVEEAPATVTPQVVAPVAAVAQLPAETVLPVETLLPVTAPVAGAATTVTNTVTNTVTGTAASAIPAVEPVLGGVVGVVSAGADVVLPVVTETVEAVDAVEIVDAVVGVVPSVLGTPLPGPDLAIPLPLPIPTLPDVLSPSNQLEAEAGAPTAEVPPASQNRTPAGQLAGFGTGGFGTGQSLLIPPVFGNLAATGDSAVSPPVPGTPAPAERQLLSALAAGPGSAFTGSAGGGAQAWAEVAGFWALPLAARGARMPAPHQLPPAAPSFDPGSSPD